MIHRHTRLVAWTILLAAVIHPPHGWQIKLCWWKAATGLPCPGCGLARSISCTCRGMFAEAWAYHPFGPFLALVMLAVAAHTLLPRESKSRLSEFAKQNHAMRWARTSFVALFLVFGCIRSIAALLR